MENIIGGSLQLSNFVSYYVLDLFSYEFPASFTFAFTENFQLIPPDHERANYNIRLLPEPGSIFIATKFPQRQNPKRTLFSRPIM